MTISHPLVNELALASLFSLEICSVIWELVCSLAYPNPFLPGLPQLLVGLGYHSVSYLDTSSYLASVGFVEKMKMAAVSRLGRCLPLGKPVGTAGVHECLSSAREAVAALLLCKQPG